MKTSIFAAMSGLTGKEQEKFIDWFQQYNTMTEVDRVFDEHPELLFDSNATEDVTSLHALNKRKMVMPKPGQIRRIDNSLTISSDRITAVLVLSQWSDQHWLIAPFSPYTYPATPGELSTDISFHLYSVIESWNAVVVPEVFLYTRTYFLHDADEKLRKDACEIFFAQLEGTTIPTELVDRVGPVINSEFDPRIQYLLDEKQEFRPLRNALRQVECDLKFLRSSQPIWRGNTNQTVLCASKGNNIIARSASDYNIVIKIDIAKFDIKLQIFSSTRKSLSHELDLWCVVSESGTVLGAIINGACCMRRENVTGTFCLVSPDGEFVMLEELEHDNSYGQIALRPLWQDGEIALAAGNEKENIRKKCVIDGRPEVLILEYSPEENTAWIDLFDEGGSRSTALDGAEVIDAEEKVFGVISDGRCEFATGPAFDGSIALRDADGVIRTLTAIS